MNIINIADQTLRGSKTIYIETDNVKYMNVTQNRDQLRGPNT
jgi:hypothetical protein